MIAVSGIDMAAWDALAKAAGLPLAEFLGGTLAAGPGLQQQRPVAYRCVDKLGDGSGRAGRRGRLQGRSSFASAATASLTISPRSRAVRDGGRSGRQADGRFQPGPDASAMRCVRCHALDDQGLYWFEEPITYDNLAGYAQLARELEDAGAARRELLRPPRAVAGGPRTGAGDYVMPDLMRIGGVTGWLRAAAIAGAAGMPMSTHLYPGVRRPPDARHRDRALARMAGLGRPDPRGAVRARQGRLVIPDRPGSASSGTRRRSSGCVRRLGGVRCRFEDPVRRCMLRRSRTIRGRCVQ